MTADFGGQRIDLALEADFQLGTVDVRPSTRQVEAGGASETLEPRIMQVLVALARKQGQVVSRDELIETCWEGRIVGDDALNRCISRIRKLGDGHDAFRLETVPRVGYRLLVGEGSKVRAGSEPALQPTSAALRQLLARRGVLLAGFGGLVAAGAIGWVALSPRGPSAGTRFRSVAVLPFEDRSPGGGQDFLAEGLAESLLDRLAKNRELTVPARTSSFAFRGMGVTAAEIARELNVETVLEGSVAREGDTVRIRAALSEANSGRQIWSANYERDLTQLESMFQLQDEITAAIARELQAAIGARSVRTQARPANREAWEAFLEGNALMARGNAESAKQAQAAFARAIEADPRYAPAHARLATALLYSPANASILENAREEIAKAFALDPDLPDAIYAEAMASVGRPTASTARLEKLVAEDPGNVDAQALLVVMLVMRGRLKDAEAPMRVVQQLDPLGANSVVGADWLLEMTGRSHEALKLTERALRLHPHDGRLHQGRIVEYAYTGDYPGFVRAAVEGLEEVPEEPEVRILARYAFAWAGFEQESLSVALNALEQLAAWSALETSTTRAPVSREAAQSLSGRTLAVYSSFVTTEPRARLAGWEAYHRELPYAQHYFLGPRGYQVYLLAARRDAGDQEGARAIEREISDFHRQMDAEGWSGLVADTQKLCFAAVLGDHENVWRRWDALHAKGVWYLPEPRRTLFDPLRGDPKFQDRMRRYEAARAEARSLLEREGLLNRIRQIIANRRWTADPKPL